MQVLFIRLCFIFKVVFQLLRQCLSLYVASSYLGRECGEDVYALETGHLVGCVSYLKGLVVRTLGMRSVLEFLLCCSLATVMVRDSKMSWQMTQP